MNFFQHFNRTPYTFLVGTEEVTLDITNILSHVQIVDKLKQHVTVFYDYIIADGDRPDTVATKVYGGPEFTWIVLVMNNITSAYDWPLDTTEFNSYIVDKYTSVSNAATTYLYTTADGYLIDETSYNLLPGTEQGDIISMYDDETTKNEAKRRIKMVPQAFVGPLVSELKRAFI